MATASALIPEPAPAIAAIALRPSHVVRVFFTDGEVRDVDLTPTFESELFSRLRDPDLFAAAHIGEITGGLEWTDDIGLDPDVIYAAQQTGPTAPRIPRAQRDLLIETQRLTCCPPCPLDPARGHGDVLLSPRLSEHAAL